MFFSLQQIRRSLDKLASLNPFFGTSFLAFKAINLPVNTTTSIVFSQIANAILDTYYRIDDSNAGFYSPFRTSKNTSKWVKPRYGSTSLQRITADTFADALIHPKNSSEWGWKASYVAVLQEHLDRDNTRISLFDLAVWLFRDRSWRPGVQASEVRLALTTLFNLTPQEVSALCEPGRPFSKSWLQEDPVRPEELYETIGPPPGAQPAEGASLDLLKLAHVGPARLFTYQPGQRLNLLTGDNSLGKTFLLECIWWALTAEWLNRPIAPRNDAARNEPLISYDISVGGKSKQHFRARYIWEQLDWTRPTKRATLPGVVLYARYDGSFAIWDPARIVPSGDGIEHLQKHILLTSEDVWNGLPSNSRSPGKGGGWMLCNGIILDWVVWQRSEEHKALFSVFAACIRDLSPSLTESLKPGRPRKLPPDTREIPTIEYPFGEVPIIYASAGVKRMLTLAYCMVWSWYQHLENSAAVRKPPQERLVIMIDEVEAHLHPRWQRSVLPSLMKAVAELSSALIPQIHLSTHSPLVLASAEEIFDPGTDGLHHLRLSSRGEVTLELLEFQKEGRVDRWLTSDVFGLDSPRSEGAEEAIERANLLQREERNATADSVLRADRDLRSTLAQDDDFWPRWRFFASRFGVT